MTGDRSAMKAGSLGRWAAVLVWMGVIFFFSSQPSLPSMGSAWLEELRNIAGHWLAYVVLAYLVSRAVAPYGSTSWARLVLVLAWCAVYALSDEWRQSFVPGRNADGLDWVIDMLGALAGCSLYFRFPLLGRDGYRRRASRSDVSGSETSSRS
jgi:VanZ family protein